jgi:NADPH:quinone reductase-like Zn-dependent oxidoreductase
MKAVVCPKYGPPEILQIKNVQRPVPKDDEVLIKIHAATVNRTDVALFRAKPFVTRFITGFFKPKHAILGTEFAGEVESVGKKVRSFKIGDRVFGFSETKWGAHAEYMVMSANKAISKIPKNMSFEEAAACSEGSWYAQNFYNKVEFKKGQKVLVNGATGAIGSAAVQLGRYFGANVTATCRGKHFDLVKGLGANRCTDYTKEDFTKEDVEYDYVFDSVGKSTFGRCKRVLKPRGAYISSELGPWSQNIFLALLTPVFSKKKVKFPYPSDCRGCVQFTSKLMRKGKYKAVIDREYPLDDIVKAFKYVEKGQKVGSVVIKVEQDD